MQESVILEAQPFMKYGQNRDEYTDAKSEFVIKNTEKAKLTYGNRY